MRVREAEAREVVAFRNIFKAWDPSFSFTERAAGGNAVG